MIGSRFGKSYEELKSGVRLVAITLVFVLPLTYAFISTFTLYIDKQAEALSLGYRFMLANRRATTVQRGQLWAFSTDSMAELFQPGEIIGKQIVGVPGDQIDVDSVGVYVNGQLVRKHDAPCLKEGICLQFRSEQIPDGRFFGVGTHPRSYDSRFWGYIEQDRLIGRLHGIL